MYLFLIQTKFRSSLAGPEGGKKVGNTVTLWRGDHEIWCPSYQEISWWGEP